MSNDYNTEAAAVAEAMNAVYENKQTNKKNDISGDFSSDNTSYPTVKAAKNQFGNKVASWSNPVSDTNYPSEKLVKDSLDNKANSTHTHSATEVTDSNANQYTYIGTLSSNASQQTINNAINTALSNMSGLNAIVITNDKGTPSASTMGKLYIVNEDQKVNVYYTELINGSYSWHKMDVDMLDEYSVGWSDVQDKPSTFTPSSHTHGNLSNDGKVGSNANYFVYTTTNGAVTSKQKIGNITTDGKIGSTANLPIITTTSGTLTTGSFGSSSGTFAEGNHTHSNYTTTSDVQTEIQSFATALANAINPSS